MRLKSSFDRLHVISCFPFQYWNWEVGLFKRIWYYIYGIRPKDDHQRKISTEISSSKKLELFIQRIVKKEWAKFIWNGDDTYSRQRLNFDWSWNILCLQSGYMWQKYCHCYYWHQIEEGALLEHATLIDKPRDWYNHTVWVGYFVGWSF